MLGRSNRIGNSVTVFRRLCATAAAFLHPPASIFPQSSIQCNILAFFCQQATVFSQCIASARFTPRLRRYFTFEIMSDPVVAVDGFTSSPPSPLPLLPSSSAVRFVTLFVCSYERASITEWFARNSRRPTNPKTGEKFRSEPICTTRFEILRLAAECANR